MSKVFQVKPKRLKRSNGTVLTPEMVVTVTTMQHTRSEEHTSELQSRFDLVCRLLLEKKKKP